MKYDIKYSNKIPYKKIEFYYLQELDNAIGDKYSNIDLLKFAERLANFKKFKKKDKSLYEDIDKFYSNYFTLNLSTAFNKHIMRILVNESKNNHFENEENNNFKIKEDFKEINNSSYSIFEGLVAMKIDMEMFQP